MSNLLRRTDIIRVLEEAGIDFDPEATMVQLRPLYDSAVSRNVSDQQGNLPDAQPNSDDQQQQRAKDEQQQLHPSALQQQQPDATVSVQNRMVNSDLCTEEAELDRQLAIARKKRELLELQRELVQIETRKIDLHVLDAMVVKFDGSELHDIEKWLDNLENVFLMFRYNERDKLVATRHLMTGRAKRFAEITSAFTYEQFKVALLTEYKRAYTVRDVFNQLTARTIKSNETPREYIIEMQYIASRANIPEVDLIDLIIVGLNDRSVHASILYGAQTLAELKSLMERYEKLRRVSMQSKQSATPDATVKPKSNVPDAGANDRTSTYVTKSAAAVDLSKVRCYNCFDYGHYQSKCTAPRRKPNSCFVCHEVGHTRHDCPKKKKPEASASRAVASVGNPPPEVNYMDNWDIPENENEVRRLATQLSSMQLVSVAFLIEQNKCTELMLKHALFDSGSPVSFVRCSMVPFMKNKLKTTSYRGMGNKNLSTYGRITCKFVFKGKEVMHNFFILPDSEAVVPLLVGRDLLKKLEVYLCHLKSYKYTACELIRIKNDMNKDEMPRSTSALKLFNLFKSPWKDNTEASTTDNFMYTESVIEYSGKRINVIGDNNPEVSVSNDLDSCETRFNDCIGVVHLNETKDFIDYSEVILLVGTAEADGLNDLIDIDKKLEEKYADALKSTIFQNHVKTKEMKQNFSSYSMQIKLKNDEPVYSNPRRLSHKEKIEVQKTIDDLLTQGIIRPSSSPYASPIVLVRRKNGELRMCVDYRALNRLTLRDHFPLPLIEDCLEYLGGGKKYFSTLDLKNGFHQVPMHPDSIPLTAFVTPMGQYEYVYMPFGLTNAPPVFQRFICLVLRKLIDARRIVVYLDDINVATKTIEEHIEVLTGVLTLLAEAGLKLNLRKCKFAYDEIQYLGYVVNEHGIRPNEAHLGAIRNYKVPTDAKEVQRCVGLFSYFRRFVHDFSRIVRPLNQLIKNDAKFEWTDECMNAFLQLKAKLTEAPVLSIFDPKRETELHTDASSHGYGAVLLQKQDDEKFHPVAYFSKTTTDAESRYHSFELETLAIVNALERFRTFLDGIPFVIVTDCNSLVMALEKKLINPRIARWTLSLANFTFSIRHRPGEQMAHVDALSRVGLSVCSIMENEVDLNIQIIQMRDEKIKRLKERLETEEVPGYELENGLVFRVGGESQQLYVPFEMETNIIRLMHENYGHLGVDKCTNQIQKHYWFPHMRERVNKFIRNCLKCIYYSTNPRKHERNLYNIPKKPDPFDTLHIDHLGPLETVNSKHKHVLVVIDAFTKFTKLYAVNTGTKETICALRKYFTEYSRPRRIVNDRGTGLKSKEFEEFLCERNIVHILNAVASPQSNGQVERVNRVLKSVLAKITDPISHTDWKKRLSDVEFAMNNTVHCTTKQTPSVMLFGIEQRGEVVDELTEYLHEIYAKDQESLESVRAQATEAIQKSQSYNQKYFERHHKPAKTFNPGDLVVIMNVDTTVGKNKKLIKRFKGPYVIRKRLDHDRYVVTDIENCQVTQMPYNSVIDSSRIKLWLEPEQELNETDTEGNTLKLEIEPLSNEYTDYEILNTQD